MEFAGIRLVAVFTIKRYDKDWVYVEPNARKNWLMSTWVLVEDEPDIYEVVLELYGVWGIARACHG